MFSHLLSRSWFSIEKQQRGEKKNLNGVLSSQNLPEKERKTEKECRRYGGSWGKMGVQGET